MVESLKLDLLRENSFYAEGFESSEFKRLYARFRLRLVIESICLLWAYF